MVLHCSNQVSTLRWNMLCCLYWLWWRFWILSHHGTLQNPWWEEGSKGIQTVHPMLRDTVLLGQDLLPDFSYRFIFSCNVWTLCFDLAAIEQARRLLLSKSSPFFSLDPLSNGPGTIGTASAKSLSTWCDPSKFNKPLGLIFWNSQFTGSKGQRCKGLGMDKLDLTLICRYQPIIRYLYTLWSSHA